MAAPDGYNQYQFGGPAACTTVAVRFLALTPKDQPANPEHIMKALQGHGFAGDEHPFVNDVIAKFINVETSSDPLEVDIGNQGGSTIQGTLGFLWDDPEGSSALIVCRGITLAIRKQGDAFEIFDSHGDRDVLENGNEVPAYVYRAPLADAVKFLEKKFPVFDFRDAMNDLMQIYPVKII